MTDFERLCDLIVLEQFKNSVPEILAVYISEKKLSTAAEAASCCGAVVARRERMDWTAVLYRLSCHGLRCFASPASQEQKGTTGVRETTTDTDRDSIDHPGPSQYEQV